jgi:hypothetical protein
MSYEPETGHVVTFTNTQDTKTLYHVSAAGPSRLEVTPVSKSGDGYAEVSINLSRDLFREMGGAPIVLDNDEMAAMEAIYTLKLLEALDLVEMVMGFAAVLPEIAAALLSPKDMEDITKSLDEFKTGLDFLRKARADAGVSV